MIIVISAALRELYVSSVHTCLPGRWRRRLTRASAIVEFTRQEVTLHPLSSADSSSVRKRQHVPAGHTGVDTGVAFLRWTQLVVSRGNEV